ncbi:MAG: hemolysin family protein [Lachnospiraceae bacterium]|nr:hemolysin family protein [Lachnospiraceae bacterium]
MDEYAIIELIVLVLLIFLSGFFSSAETAFTSVSKIRIHSLAEDGNKAAKLVDKILDKKSKMLSAILIGNNIVNLTASSLATVFAMKISLWVGLMTVILTVIIIICGEIVPKNWAMTYSEKIAMTYSGLVYSLMIILTPVIFIVDNVSKLFLKLFRADSSYHETMTETELKTYVDVSHEDGIIETEEREMILNVFEFSDSEAKDVMIPRVNMITVKVSDTYEEVLDTFKESMYTRLPVYEEDKEGNSDNFLGIINIKDFLFCDDKDKFVVRDYIRDCIFTHEHKKTSDLLEEMKDGGSNISFVLNEYGDTVGMITLEDLLEEIVGEIRDEYDEDEEDLLEKVDDNTYVVDATMNLDDLNDLLETDIKSEDYDSVGGIIIEKLDRLPENDEEVVLDNGITLKVVGMEQNRIENVQIILPENTEEVLEDSDKDN